MPAIGHSYLCVVQDSLHRVHLNLHVCEPTNERIHRADDQQGGRKHVAQVAYVCKIENIKSLSLSLSLMKLVAPGELVVRCSTTIKVVPSTSVAPNSSSLTPSQRLSTLLRNTGEML